MGITIGQIMKSPVLEKPQKTALIKIGATGGKKTELDTGKEYNLAMAEIIGVDLGLDAATGEAALKEMLEIKDVSATVIQPEIKENVPEKSAGKSAPTEKKAAIASDSSGVDQRLRFDNGWSWNKGVKSKVSNNKIMVWGKADSNDGAGGTVKPAFNIGDFSKLVLKVTKFKENAAGDIPVETVVKISVNRSGNESAKKDLGTIYAEEIGEDGTFVLDYSDDKDFMKAVKRNCLQFMVSAGTGGQKVNVQYEVIGWQK